MWNLKSLGVVAAAMGLFLLSGGEVSAAKKKKTPVIQPTVPGTRIYVSPPSTGTVQGVQPSTGTVRSRWFSPPPPSPILPKTQKK